MKKSAFTLVEILIVIVLFGLLSGIILETYTTITKVAFRMEQDKELAKETLILSQVLQNIAEEATIDYSQYTDLKSKNGITDTLYLTGGQWTGTQIFSTGNCEQAGKLYNENYKEKKDQNADFSWCKLILQKGEDKNNQFTLLGTWKFLQSKMQFKVIPYDSSQEIVNQLQELSNPSEDELKAITEQWKPWFWILGAVYSHFYDPKKWSNSSILPIQLFFGLHGTTPSLYELNETTDEN